MEDSTEHRGYESISPPPVPAAAATGRRAGMPSWVTIAGVVALASGTALMIGIGIGKGRAVEPPRAPPVAAPSRQVRLPEGLAERAGLHVERITRRSFSPTLDLVGSVDFDANRVADVGGRVSGRVTQLFVTLGADVVAGAPLAEIDSRELSNSVAAYLGARANAAASRAQVERESRLLEQQLSTARTVEEARASAATHSAEMRGAEQQLMSMGLTPRDIAVLNNSSRPQRITLRSPIAGRVVRRDAVIGQTVEATSTLARVADLSELWVLLDVFERDLARVRVGDRAEIVSETYAGRVFTATVNHIDATLDRNTRTARVRIQVVNTGLLLRPGQFVTARLRTSIEGAREAVAIPRRALIQLEGRPAVFAAVGPNAYEPRPVELGAIDGEYVEVIRGVNDGETLVVDGAFALKSEMQR